MISKRTSTLINRYCKLMSELRKCINDLEKSSGIEEYWDKENGWTLGMHLNFTDFMSNKEVTQLVEQFQKEKEQNVTTLPSSNVSGISDAKRH